MAEEPIHIRLLRSTSRVAHTVIAYSRHSIHTAVYFDEHHDDPSTMETFSEIIHHQSRIHMLLFNYVARRPSDVFKTTRSYGCVGYTRDEYEVCAHIIS